MGDSYLVLLQVFVDGGGDRVALAAKLDSITKGDLFSLLDNLVGLCNLSLEVIEVLEDLLEVARHFEGDCLRKKRGLVGL